MEPYDFFRNPERTNHKHYEALRAFYLEGYKAADAAEKFGLSPNYFKKLRFEFKNKLKAGIYPFFSAGKPGPKKRSTGKNIVEYVVELRKQNYSVVDIKVALEAKGEKLSLDTIDQILKSEGFAPLPKRTKKERLNVTLPAKIEAPKCVPLEVVDEEFSTELGAGPLVFLPLLQETGIVETIQEVNFPSTKTLSDVQNVLSFLALKLLGGLRWSHDTKWNMDRALGLFAGLNVLPKAGTLSTYSYRINRAQNRKFLSQLSRIFRDDEQEQGEFNLDFKAIPHWGDDSILEKNWSGSRSKSIKSILSLIVQEPATGNLAYTNAEITHSEQKDAVFDFVDFWKSGRGIAPKMLIFDSKFTTYKNLNKLNQSKDKIKFLTLRRRGKNIIEEAESLPEKEWQKLSIERAKGKYQTIKVHDGTCSLGGYEGNVRQVILKDHGREKPTFLVSNDFELDTRDIVKKYARRWLVEQEIAEQIVFFSLNNPSSSIVVKVDFDLTLSLLAHNLYKMLSNHLPGFENCTVATISRKFIENGAQIKIKGKELSVGLKKKTHLPILFSVPWMQSSTYIPWLDLNISYHQGTVS